MNDRTHISAELRSIVDRLDQLTKSLAKPQQRDSWERVQAFATILSPLVIALVGGVFTYLWNTNQEQRTADQKQLELAIESARVVKEFLPALTSEGDERRIAIIALSKIGYPELATGIAESTMSQSSLSALKSLSASTNPQESQVASDALSRIFLLQRQNFVQIYSGNNPLASGFLLSPDVIVTANYVIGLAGETGLSIRLSDGRTVSPTKVFRDDASGIGVIRIPPSGNVTGLPLLSQQPKPGAFVVAIGDLGGKGMTPIGGKVTDVDVPIKIMFEDGRLVELRDGFYAQFETGLGGVGGGPILSEDGVVVGMLHSGTAEGRHACISSAAIARAVEKLLGIKMYGGSGA